MPKLDVDAIRFDPPAPEPPPQRGLTVRQRAVLAGIGDREARALAAELDVPLAATEVGGQVEFTLPDGQRRRGQVVEHHPEGAVVDLAGGFGMMLIPYEHLRERGTPAPAAVRAALAANAAAQLLALAHEDLGNGDFAVTVRQASRPGIPSDDQLQAFAQAHYPGARLLDAEPVGGGALRVFLHQAQGLPYDKPKAPPVDRPEFAGLAKEPIDDAENARTHLAELARTNPHIAFVERAVEQDEGGTRLAFTCHPAGALSMPLFVVASATETAELTASSLLSQRPVLAGEVYADRHGVSIEAGGVALSGPRAIIAVQHHDAAREDLNAPGAGAHFDDPIPYDTLASVEPEHEHIGGPGVQVARVDAPTREYWDAGAGYYATPETEGYGEALTRELNVARSAFRDEATARRVAAFLRTAEPPVNPTQDLVSSLLYSRWSSGEAANALDKLVVDYLKATLKGKTVDSLGDEAYGLLLAKALDYAKTSAPRRWQAIVQQWGHPQLLDAQPGHEMTTARPPQGYVDEGLLENFDVTPKGWFKGPVAAPPPGEATQRTKDGFAYLGADGKHYVARPKPGADVASALDELFGAKPTKPAQPQEPAPTGSEETPAQQVAAQRHALREAPQGTAEQPTPGTYAERTPAEAYAGRRQPASGNMRFRLENLRARGGYVVADVRWDPETLPGMSTKNIEHNVRSFVMMKASQRTPIDLGHIGRVQVVTLDVDEGHAEVRFRSSEARALPPEVIVTEEGVAYRGAF